MLDELAELNGEYRKRNGFVFLVCASGLPADAILALLKARLPNDRDAEVKLRGGGVDPRALRLFLVRRSGRSLAHSNAVILSEGVWS